MINAQPPATNLNSDITFVFRKNVEFIHKKIRVNVVQKQEENRFHRGNIKRNQSYAETKEILLFTST